MLNNYFYRFYFLLLIIASSKLIGMSPSFSSNLNFSENIIKKVLEDKLKFATAIPYLIDGAIEQNQSHQIKLLNKQEILLLIDLINTFYENKLKDNNNEIIKKSLLKEKSDLLEKRNFDGFSLLDVATIYRDKDIAKKLLDSGYNINSRPNKFSKSAEVFTSPMWIFDYIYKPENKSMVSRPEMLQFYIDYGYDTNILDSNGYHILYWALYPQFIKIVSQNDLKQLLSILIKDLLNKEQIKNIPNALSYLEQLLGDTFVKNNVLLKFIVSDLFLPEILSSLNRQEFLNPLLEAMEICQI